MSTLHTLDEWYIPYLFTFTTPLRPSGERLCTIHKIGLITYYVDTNLKSDRGAYPASENLEDIHCEYNEIG